MATVNLMQDTKKIKSFNDARDEIEHEGAMLIYEHPEIREALTRLKMANVDILALLRPGLDRLDDDEQNCMEFLHLHEDQRLLSNIKLLNDAGHEHSDILEAFMKEKSL